MCSVIAHLAECGQSEVLYQKNISRFVEIVPAVALWQMHESSCVTLVAKIKQLIGHEKEAVKHIDKKSGIVEKRGEKKMLKNDSIQELNEKEDMSRGKEAERTDNQRRMGTAGEHTKEQALKRCISVNGANKDEPDAAKKQSYRGQKVSNSDDKGTSAILFQAEEHQKSEK